MVVVVVKTKKKGMRVGKNVTLEIDNIHTVMNYTYKTRRNFSQTLNIIIEEWDKFSILIEKLKQKQKQEQDFKYLDELKNGKVVE